MSTFPPSGMLYGFDVGTDGQATALEAGAPMSPLGEDIAYRWIHIDLEDASIESWLDKYVDPIIVDSLIHSESRPRFDHPQNGAFLVLRGVNLNAGENPEDMVSIRLWIKDRVLISTRKRKLMAVVDMRERIEAGKAPLAPGTFIAKLASDLTDRMDFTILSLADKLDEIEDESLTKSENLRGKIASLRQKAIQLRRHISPQREALYRLVADEKLLSAQDRLLIREVLDRVTRMIEELDTVRERASVLNDQLADKRAEEMNKNMMVLSVVAAIFLPLGFFTGLFGINIPGIPGTEYPNAFWIFTAILGALTAALLLFFKWLKWL